MKCTTRDIQNDRGLGMTELAVAILVLGIVLIGLFPLVLNSVSLAVSNADIGRANLIVSSQIDQARLTLSSQPCLDGTQPLTISNPRDAEKFAGVVEIDCTGTRLASVDVRVWRQAEVTAGEPEGPIISSAKTKVITAS